PSFSGLGRGGEGSPFQGPALVPGQDGGIDPVSLFASRWRRRSYIGGRTNRRRKISAAGADGAPISSVSELAFDFGCSVRAATIAMGGDWHDIGGVLSGESAEFVELQPLAAIDDPSERGWALEWIAAIL